MSLGGRDEPFESFPLQLHLVAWDFLNVIQLCAKYKYWKPSLELFFISFVWPTPLRITLVIRVSFFFPHVSWFDSFITDQGKFLKCYMLVKPITLKAHSAFYFSSALMGCARSCQSGLLKYWSRTHFCQPLSSYHSILCPLSSEEVKMKEDLCIWYQGLHYEEGFGLGEVPISQQKKKCIDTYAIIITPDYVERQKLFGEDRDSCILFFTSLACSLQITWIIYIRLLRSPRFRVL